VDEVGIYMHRGTWGTTATKRQYDVRFRSSQQKTQEVEDVYFVNKEIRYVNLQVQIDRSGGTQMLEKARLA
jgi:hypothetical protein